MLKYILRRILVFLPTLIIISLLAFVISINAPGDPVERLVTAAQSGGEVSTQSANQLEQKKFWRTKLGLDLPVFYFSLSNIAIPDTLFKIVDQNERATLSRLIDQYGNWNDISQYFTSLKILNEAHGKIKLDSSVYQQYTSNEIKEAINTARFESLSLISSYAENVIQSKFKQLDVIYKKYPFVSHLGQLLEVSKDNYEKLKLTATPWKNNVPSVKFYANNQYHRWMFGDGGLYTNGVIRGDFGTSYKTKESVTGIISKRIGVSLGFTLVSVFLAYLISIPIGIRAAVKKDSTFDRVSTVILFVLYSMPSFFVGTLLLMTFANPDMFYWFEASGIKPAQGYPDGAGLLEKFQISLPYLVLPAICYTYSSFAFLSRTMRVSMLETVNQDFIRTARAKGLPESAVIYKHALRNALLPIITIFANIFPLAVGGSVILETIFTLPGMGHEVYKAIQDQDYPMIVAVFTITGMLTLVGFLISDILYALVDPRISFSKK